MKKENLIALYAGKHYRIEKLGVKPTPPEFAKTFREADGRRIALKKEGVIAKIYSITSHGSLIAA